jgi:hypothetical protein
MGRELVYMLREIRGVCPLDQLVSFGGANSVFVLHERSPSPPMSHPSAHESSIGNLGVAFLGMAPRT